MIFSQFSRKQSGRHQIQICAHMLCNFLCPELLLQFLGGGVEPLFDNNLTDLAGKILCYVSYDMSRGVPPRNYSDQKSVNTTKLSFLCFADSKRLTELFLSGLSTDDVNFVVVRCSLSVAFGGLTLESDLFLNNNTREELHKILLIPYGFNLGGLQVVCTFCYGLKIVCSYTMV